MTIASPRQSEYAIDAQFIERWSPRSFTNEEIPTSTLFTLFEAARWAPSAGNQQPWRFIYSRRDSASWEIFTSLLAENNRAWPHRAGETELRG